ncbi:MAG: ABC transporter ATP-binding protein, partial [Tistlia sp.]
VGLDIDSRRAILEHLRRLVAEESLALLWATHLVDEVVPGNRVVILHQGRVLADGELTALLAESGQADIGALFSALTRGAPAAAAAG